jgi:hypothetical protein
MMVAALGLSQRTSYLVMLLLICMLNQFSAAANAVIIIINCTVPIDRCMRPCCTLYCQ